MTHPVAELAETDEPKLTPKQGFFDSFSFGNNQADTVAAAYQQFFNQELLSSKTVLKILAITGKDVLLNGISTDAKDVFASILSEKNVSGILLCDQNGAIKYATNAKFEARNIQQIFPDFDATNPAMGWGSSETEMVTSMPIYHTFGKVGTVILVVKKVVDE